MTLYSPYNILGLDFVKADEVTNGIFLERT